MPASDLPQGTAEDSALSFNDGVDAISNLIDAPEKEPKGKVEAQEEEADQPDETDEVEPGPDDADAAEDEEAENPDGSEDIKGGRFAPDTAKVTLDDGTVISVAELKRNNLFQRDYTRKTTELKQERETFSQYQEQMGKVAQSLAQQRDFVFQAAQRFVPRAPDRAMLDPASQSFDPIAYTQQKADYDEHMQVLNQLNYQQQAERGRMSEEQKIAANQLKAQEWEALSTAVPEFKDSKVYTKFWGDAVETMAAYGFAEHELSETIDHRMYLAMRDLVQFRRAKQQAPKVKQEIEAKPRIMPGGRRMDPKNKTTREAAQRSEQLRKNGTFDAGIAALMDLPDL